MSHNNSHAVEPITSTFHNRQSVQTYGSMQNTANDINKVFSMYEDHLKESSE